MSSDGSSITITANSDPDDRRLWTRVRQVRVVFSPAGRTQSALLERSPVKIGRAGHVEGPLALDDAEVSRHHATIQPEGPGDWSIADAGSRNGIFVDGARVPAAVLQPGSVLRVGRTLMIYSEHELPENARLVPESSRLSGPGITMQRLRGEIAQVAPEKLPVLILGPTGSGKELVAAELHFASGRKGPFIAVNCAALPEALAESELFGHVAGAFTGADRRKEGLVAAADGGTLFLDEVGELPAPVQAKLLRTLATGEVRPVGGTDAAIIDVRVVSATHRDLGALVTEDVFRADLFARLAGWTLRVPSLAARREDVLALAAVFLTRAGGPSQLTADAAEALLLHDWPYNVRELEQMMRAAAVRAAGVPRITLAHLPPELSARVGHRGDSTIVEDAPPPLELLVPRDQVPSRADLLLVVERFQGNVSRIAAYFGKDRKQVYRWAKSLDVPL